MSVVSAIVLFAFIWFVVLFCVLPIRMQTQGEAGEVVPGTHASAPANLNMKRRAFITTIIAFVLWALVAGTILYGGLSIRDFDWFNRMSTPEVYDTNG